MQKFTRILLVGLMMAVPQFEQSVRVVGKKQIYIRRKPITGYKRSFSIRRPIVTAATPSLSRAITAAVNAKNVLDIRLKDELGEYQWLEDSDFSVHYSETGFSL